jgi:hypothetical protein
MVAAEGRSPHFKVFCLLDAWTHSLFEAVRSTGFQPHHRADDGGALSFHLH